MDDRAHTTRALDAMAHGLRNDLSVALGGLQLVQDGGPVEPEVAAETRIAMLGLARVVERLVASARIELGREQASAQLTIPALLAMADRRARREGSAVALVVGDGDELVVEAPGIWLERLVADLVHIAGAHGALELQVAATPVGSQVQIEFRADHPESGPRQGAAEEFAAVLAHRIASACSGQLELRSTGSDFVALLVLPAATPTNAR